MNIITLGLGPGASIPTFLLMGLYPNADVQEPTAHVEVRVRPRPRTVAVQPRPHTILVRRRPRTVEMS